MHIVSSTQETAILSKPEAKELAEAKTGVAGAKLQTSSKLSQVGANGGSAKEQAFQLPRTGALSCWQTPPRRPSGL